MARDSDIGKRLLAKVIDSFAINDPTKIWASIPVNDLDLTQGFRDITYEEFANAINRASWWITQHVTSAKTPFETLAYAGPKDLRYPILAVAAVKCGKQLLLTSPFATREVRMHLLSVTGCKIHLHAASLQEQIQSTIGANPSVQLIAVPELNEWLSPVKVGSFLYEKTWEEAYSDPWLIFHTSGTTGLPKPIVYTNWMMTSFDAAELMPDADRETMNDHFRDSRFYTALPSLHFVGMTAALQWTVFLNMILVAGPPTYTKAEEVLQILRHGKVSGAVLPPSLIEEVGRCSEGMDCLRQLRYLYFVGAPLPASTAEHLVGHCKLQPGMGSTEAGAYFISIRNDDDWEYYEFRPSMGVEFEQKTPELFELVFRRRPELARWQQLFHLYPDLEVFPTHDLWTKHPSKPGLWRYAARTDDLIIFSHGEDLWASEMEAEIQKHPKIRAALMGGQGRPHPFVIIELTEDASTLSSSSQESMLAEVWPSIAKANEKCSEYVQLTEKLVIFTDPEKLLPRTTKDTVARQAGYALYLAEIERLYSYQ